MGVTEQLQKGFELHQAGRIAEAEARYNSVLRVDPKQPDALHLLGLIRYGQGKYDQTIELISAAIEFKSDFPPFHLNLGNALHKVGDLGAAEACHRQALVLQPELVEAHVNLANTLRDQGQIAEAEASYRRGLEVNPRDAAAHGNLGSLLGNQNRFDEALSCFQAALEINPQSRECLGNLAGVFQDLGRLEEAERVFRQILEIEPNNFEVHTDLGVTLTGQGKLDEAVEAHRQAIILRPDSARAYNNLGVAFQEHGKLAEAREAFEKAIEIDQELSAARVNLGYCHLRRGRFRQGRELIANASDVRRAQSKDHSSQLFFMQYAEEETSQSIWQEAHRWQKWHAARCERMELARNGPGDCEKKLRVGYVSADLRRHSVSAFMEAILTSYDRQEFETYCYYNWPEDDEVSTRLKELVNAWREVSAVSNEALAAIIRDDRIDILVDLSGHDIENRLLVFARKPAPVLVTYLGYPGTTGLEAIDYRISDQWADPEDEGDDYSSEEVVRLPKGFHCYTPPDFAPNVSGLPALECGHVTFGSFNNVSKVSERVIDVWCRILLAVPGARLIIKHGHFADDETRLLFRNAFANCGVEANRLEFLEAEEADRDHMATYNRVDIGLDPFPYNGTATTCEALWMGVPVITLRGNRHAGRVGESLLNNIGLVEFIAADEQAYVDLAVTLANDLKRLDGLRSGMRERLKATPLLDAVGFTRTLEEVYRMIWRRHCKGAEAD